MRTMLLLVTVLAIGCGKDDEGGTRAAPAPMTPPAASPAAPPPTAPSDTRTTPTTPTSPPSATPTPVPQPMPIPSAPSAAPPKDKPATDAKPKASPPSEDGAGDGVEASRCVLTPCHGLEGLSCAPPSDPCTAIYRIGDVCRELASCKGTAGACSLSLDPKFAECKRCVDACEGSKIERCEAECKKKIGMS